ncbi:MAG: bifunctional phosphoribosyl-AMP cyclohydrolase/phosphoribosyl-ATP diphosphatase HisIE [Blautia sp.]|nr:bifunctional phosphoribosyl-AMP cyclohydrolase/phosphoribosyl-ATP diphosphatase HisIE [Blautia sp.]
MNRRMIPCIHVDGAAGTDNASVIRLAQQYRENGADELLVVNDAADDASCDAAILLIKEICAAAEIPVMGRGHVKRLEDVKKLLYAGCACVAVDIVKEKQAVLLEEASRRFGKDKVIAAVSGAEILSACGEKIRTYGSALLLPADRPELLTQEVCDTVIMETDTTDEQMLLSLLSEEKCAGLTGAFVNAPDRNLMAFKDTCKESGIAIEEIVSAFTWDELKTDEKGLIPAIVQDYKTDEVLMLAYMDKEAFETTIRTGRMTYYSRSRKEQWVKGLTSGHFQYVKELWLDCDNDTILAKVDQIGAACHTGNKSCFYRPILRKEYHDTNTAHVLQDVYEVILDRKANPREGSYTNYLFDKGIDKILKKVGEECTEIVIAAKNPDKEEIKYEISDFLYHVMVLMVEKGVTWEEITDELARR